MQIVIDNEFIFRFKDALMVEFLKEDLELVKQNLIEDFHPDDVKYNKKLLKAYRKVLDYYGVEDGQA